MGEDGLGSDGGYCFGASGAMWSDDMWSVFVICSFVTCFVGVVVIIWSDDMWSADVAFALVAASSASAYIGEGDGAEDDAHGCCRGDKDVQSRFHRTHFPRLRTRRRNWSAS